MNRFYLFVVAAGTAFFAGWLFANEYKPPRIEDVNFAAWLIAAAAEQLNLAGYMQAQIGVAESALVAFVNVLYATDADQQPANIDADTGRILIPLPWGSAGWRHWGLRKTEATHLRKILKRRALTRRPAPLFGHDPDSRQWYLDVEAYPTVDVALQWIKVNAPTLTEWRQAVRAHRIADAERKDARRYGGK